MHADFQFKIAFVERTPSPSFDPIRNKWFGSFSGLYNKQLALYNSINYSIVLLDERDYGNCDSGNCTGLIGLVQRGEADLSEKSYSFTVIPDSTTGLKPGPVLGDVSCDIFSTLPEIAIIRDDVLKSISIFTSSAIIFLAFLFFSLVSIPSILRYFKHKFFAIKTTTSAIIWPTICAILQQGSSQKTFFRRQSFQLLIVWMIIILTLFFITTLYSGAFTTDLTSKAPIKTIDSLNDVANCDKTPFWMAEPLCRKMIYDGSSRAQEEIRNRGKYITIGELFIKARNEIEIEKCVFIITSREAENVQRIYCNFNSESPMPQWYQSTGAFPVYLLFTVLNSKLSPHYTKIINSLHQKHFESHIISHLRDLWVSYLSKFMDPKKKTGCIHKTSMKYNPALYRYSQLNIQNYKLFFKYFLYMIPISILCLVGEYLYAWISPTLLK